MMKLGGELKLLWITLGLAGLVGGYFVFQDKVVDTHLRPLVEQALAKALHSPVQIQSIRAGLTGHLVLHQVDLTLPGDPWKSHVRVVQVSIDLDLIGLFFQHKPIENCFEQVSLETPQVTLIHSQDSPSPSAPVPSSPVANSGLPSVPLPVIPAGKLSIQNGVFAVETNKKPKTMLRDITLVAATKDGKIWGFSLQASSPQRESRGNLYFDGSFNEKKLKVLGKLALTQWPLISGSPALKDLSGWELLNGTIDLESPLVFQPGHIWFDAATSLSNASIQSPAPLGVVFSKINGRVFIRPTDLNIPNPLIFNVGQTAWKASGFMPFDGRSMTLQTSTTQLVLEDVFQNLIQLPNLSVDGMGSASFVATGPLSSPDVNGTAQMGLSHIGKVQVDSFSVQANYENGILHLTNVAGKLYSGQFQGDGLIALNGNDDAPITLNAVLSDLDAQKLASSFGINGMKGQGNFDVHLGGSVEEPILSARSQMSWNRMLQGRSVDYFVNANILLKNKKLKFDGTFNDKTKIEGELSERGNDWIFNRLTLQTGRRIARLTGKGVWPKNDLEPINMEIKGTDVVLEDIPFLHDQFKDINGKINLDLLLSGTRKIPQASLQITSEEIRLGHLAPEPMTVSLAWTPGELDFNQLKVGHILSIRGRLGLDADSPLDFKIKAKGVPIQTISEISGWENPPQPFKGWITGDLHVAGVRQNPIVEGSGTVDSLQLGNWTADRMEGLLELDHGDLKIKKLKLIQGAHDLSVTGHWDTLSKPGIMNLKFVANDFQLDGKPFLSGKFNWNAQTGAEFWKDWNGVFSSVDFSLGDGQKNIFHFSNFSITASFSNQILQGKVNLGRDINGSTMVDFSGIQPEIQASLKVGPVSMDNASDITQFLPASLRIHGLISGQLELKQGNLDELPMDGTFTITDGSVADYGFDRMAFSFTGNKRKIEPKFSLVRADAQYSLEGSISSPKAFWSEDSSVSINGPVKNERLSKLVSLFGIKVQKNDVTGKVNGNLDLSGTLNDISLGFSLNGQNLWIDNNFINSADLNFSENKGQITFGNNQINLDTGQINIGSGTLGLDPSNPNLILMDILGSVKNLKISPFDISKQIHISGKLILNHPVSKPTFDGLLSFSDLAQASAKDKNKKKNKPFEVAVTVGHKVVTLNPIASVQPQILGKIDFSGNKKITFDNVHLIHSTGTFSVNGTLDLEGQSKLVSDAENIPIEEVGKWLIPDFPLSGNGGYHLIFQGGLSDPVFTASVDVSDGQVGDLNFNLLSGELRAVDHVLYLGSAQVPIELTKKNAFDFTLEGKMPLAVTKKSWQVVRNNQMDIHAQMTKGDFGIILLAGFAKKASGDMDFSAHVTGTLDNPILDMDLDLSKCEMVPSMIAQSIDNISGRIKVRDNKLAVYGLNGLIGKGVVFINSPPIDHSKMVLENFIPQYLDLRVRTVGPHGVWLSIPTIMKKGEWGEICFYGATPKDPLLIRGPLTEPHVIGTAKLQSGHYTFPPEEAVDENGQKIEFRELAGVDFQLTLVAGNNCWYSNEFNTQYLELRIDPEDQMLISGRDADRTSDHPGINCTGTAGSKQGFLRYLGREFQLEEATLYIPKGRLPYMWGRATDTLNDAQIVTAGGIRTTDVNVWLDFRGTFGNIDFKLDSSPRFDETDENLNQKLLLSYIVFGRDMTGYTDQQLQSVYQQNTGQVVTEAMWETLDRISSNWVTTSIRPFAQKIGGVDINVKSQILSGGGPNAVTTAGGVEQVVSEPNGNTVSGNAVPIFQVQINKPLDPRLTVTSILGVDRNLSTENAQFQGELGLQYELRKNLTLNLMTGGNDNGQQETSLNLAYRAMLPDIMSPKKGDTVPPKFLSFDVYPIGLGKFQINWETDKVTSAEVKIFDENDQMVQDIFEKGQQSYDHQMVIDKLNPQKNYQIQITIRDLNQNTAVSTQDLSAIAD